MDSERRKELLAQKLHANWQRRGREQYLAHLPLDLSSYLAARPCLYTPELNTFVSRWYPVTAQCIGEPPRTPPGYRYTEVWWDTQALAAAEQFGPGHDTAEAVLVPFVPPDACPGFLVEFGWVRRQFGILWPYGGHQLAVVRRDLLAGLVVDNHAAMPDERNPNPEEITFEIGYWGAAVP